MSAEEPLPPGTVEHADGTIDSQPCCHCDLQTLSIVTIDLDGYDPVTLFFCRPCQEKTRDELAPLRTRFDEYIAEGMSRETANRVMNAWFLGSAK